MAGSLTWHRRASAQQLLSLSVTGQLLSSEFHLHFCHILWDRVCLYHTLVGIISACEWLLHAVHSTRVKQPNTLLTLNKDLAELVTSLLPFPLTSILPSVNCGRHLAWLGLDSPSQHLSCPLVESPALPFLLSRFQLSKLELKQRWAELCWIRPRAWQRRWERETGGYVRASSWSFRP